MPEKLVVTAQVPANEAKGTPQLGPASITVQTGADAKELVEMFGGDAVKSNAEANWVVTLQNNIRSGLRKGESAEALQARLGGAKMGVAQKGAKVDPIEAYRAQFLAATPEKQQEMLADLAKRAKAAKK